MADEASSDSECSSGEVEEAVDNRERFLDFSYITTGKAKNASFRRKEKAIKEKRKQAKKGKERASYSVSEELTVTAVNCPCHEGCTADHGAVYCAETISKLHGCLDRVNVREDTGNDANWISASDARKLGLSMLALERAWEGQTMSGEAFKATHYVSMTLVGQRTDKSCYDKFLIAPDGYPVDAIVVGLPFIKHWGHPFTLFERAGANLVVQTKKSKAERVHIEQGRVAMERKAKELSERRQQAGAIGIATEKPRKASSFASGSTLDGGVRV